MTARQKYHILLFIFSIPFPFLLFKGWWSEHIGSSASQGYSFLALFALLAEIYFASRKLVVLGMIGIGAFIIGFMFKIQHWPGAQLSILLSTLLLIAIPLWSALLNPRDKKLNMIISIWILLYGAGALFKMFHWPASGLIFLLSWFFLPVVTISLGINFWKNKTAKA